MKSNKLYSAADRAINQALRLRPGERFLLVTDTQKLEIAEALAYYAKRAGAETTTYLMTETLRPIEAPTRQFKELIRGASVTVYMLEGRFPEKPFRGFMVAEGAKNGRICMMPGITRDMMERLVNIDFSEMARFTRKVMRAMKDADDVVIENPAGTRISFSVKGRTWDADIGDISKKGVHGNLPAGECFTAPVEETFSGKLVIGLIDDKLGHGVMEFKRGKLVGFRGKGDRRGRQDRRRGPDRPHRRRVRHRHEQGRQDLRQHARGGEGLRHGPLRHRRLLRLGQEQEPVPLRRARRQGHDPGQGPLRRQGRQVPPLIRK